MRHQVSGVLEPYQLLYVVNPPFGSVSLILRHLVACCVLSHHAFSGAIEILGATQFGLPITMSLSRTAFVFTL
jgi:hypothetical protein